MAVEFLQILLYSTCVCANMAQILRKKDTITVDDMKKEAEREARTMWQFVRTFLKWLVIAGVTGGIGGLVGSAFHLSVNWAAAFRAAHPWLLWLLPIGGLLIAAKNDGAHLALAQQLQDHSLYREYEAVVLGNLREDQGTISLPIARHPTDRKKMAVNHSSGRPAVTHWTVLARYPGYTHVQCRLETGRTHQIRVHMAAQGHPVLGDPVYNGLRKGFPELAGQCLHARRLSFQHPRTGERMTLSSPLPAYFQTVLTRCSRLV